MNRTLAFALATLLLPAVAAADVVRLKNGNTMEGAIESETDQEVRMSVGGGIVTFRPDEVLSIEKGPIASPKPAASSNQHPLSKLDSFRRQIGKERRAGHRRTARPPESGSVALPELDFRQAWWHPSSKTGQWISQQAERLSSAGVPVLAGIIFVVLFHFVCIYGVAKKTGTGHAWLAFVPVLNLLTICWMGGLPSWWLIPLFLADGFHPLAAAIGNAVFFFGFVGPGIAHALRKPWWIGPLLFLYPLAFLVWAYLAFSTEKQKPKVELPPGFKLPT